MEFERRNQHFDRMVNTPGLRWMGQNTNHHRVHPAVADAMKACIETGEFHVYAPPVGLEELRALVNRDLDLDGMVPIVTDGAVAALYHVCRTICGPGDQFITTDPTWNWPKLFAREAGAEILEIPIYGQQFSYRLAPKRLRAAVTERTRAIYIVDPNNPLGTCCTAQEIAEIAAIARQADAYLIQDCTYRDFAYEHHLAARHYPEKTLTTWSFSKWLGLAGLRIGVVIGNSEIMERLAAASPNMLGSNILSQRAAIAGLKIRDQWFPEVLAEQRANQERLRSAVAAIDGLAIPVFPSNGNFVIVECGGAGVKPEIVCAILARSNILVRQGSYHTSTFGERFIKVSTSVPPAWMEELCERLPGALAEAHGQDQAVQLY